VLPSADPDAPYDGSDIDEELGRPRSRS
jgi:hypothetical protein